ncbi:MAG: hypothetical protein R3F49_25335 [Planctomycetota bacterium]
MSEKEIFALTYGVAYGQDLARPGHAAQGYQQATRDTRRAAMNNGQKLWDEYNFLRLLQRAQGWVDERVDELFAWLQKTLPFATDVVESAHQWVRAKVEAVFSWLRSFFEGDAPAAGAPPTVA